MAQRNLSVHQGRRGHISTGDRVKVTKHNMKVVELKKKPVKFVFRVFGAIYIIVNVSINL